MEIGLVHIYTGDGKGKTSASVGLCVRAAGRNKRVLFVQFLKGQQTGEVNSLKQIGVEVVRATQTSKFVPYMTEDEKNMYAKEHQMCYNSIKASITNGAYDVVVLDEVIPTAEMGIIEPSDLISLVKSKSPHTELVLTGRNAPKSLIELADYVTVMQCLAHPYIDNNIDAREGIEF